MATCRFCKNEIDLLTRVGTVRESANFFVDGGARDYDNFETDYDDTTEWEFLCPDCGECISHDEESAVAFLAASPVVEVT